MAIKLYWCRGKGRSDPKQQNFGDYLSPLIVEAVSGKPVEYAPVKHADMIAIGTILGRLEKARRFLLPRRLHVWGSGAGKPEERFSGRHYYHAVRGRLTASQIEGLRGTPAFGDPGLLAGMLAGPAPDKKYRVGLIPHYVDKAHPFIAEAARWPGSVVIDVFSPIPEILRQIRQCDFVLSSSMHGLIVSDAFGVPNRRLVLSEGIIDEHKFHDYYTAFGIATPDWRRPADFAEAPPDLDLELSDYQRPHLERIQRGLIESFPQL